MSKNEVLSKNYDVSRRIWNGNVCGNCNISHRCPSRMAGCSGAFAVAVFQYGNKAIWECEVGVKVRIHVASSFTCPYLVAMILHSGMDLCYGFSFFAFFFSSHSKEPHWSWGGTALLSFLCVQKNWSLKILTDLHVKRVRTFYIVLNIELKQAFLT